jgi:Tfp pilus assembly protein PilF
MNSKTIIPVVVLLILAVLSVSPCVAAAVPADAEAHYERGLAFFARSEYARAVEEFTQALALDPRHVRALHARGAAYSLQGQYDLALADFTRAVD